MIRAIIDGILSGGVYALMAAGLTLIFGVMDIVNFAQGVLVVLGSYLSYVLEMRLGIGLFLGLFITIPALFLLGVGLEWAFMRRLQERERTAMSVLVTYGAAIIIQGVLILIFGSNFLQLHASYVNQSFDVGGIYLPQIYVYGFLLAVGLLAALYAVLYRSKFGASVRASLQDRAAARLVGINVQRVSTITFGIGVCVTAAGGMVFGATNAFDANSGYDLISRLFAIVILGGLGSIGGALGAAVFMTVIEAIVATVWAPIWGAMTFYLAMVLVLAIKPEGIFGRRAARAQ
ncbi:MAG: branched-chain amino acid ABC transporter permease [Acidimicrobiales bacterium]